MKKQMIFSKKNAQLFYISPYVEVYRVYGKGILFKRVDYKSNIYITINDYKVVESILSKLSKGNNIDELINFFYSIGIKDAEIWIKKFIEMGILE